MNDKQMANTRLGPGPETTKSYLGKKHRSEQRMAATKKRVAARDRLKAKRLDEMPDGLAKQIAMLK
mgnify:CR=1 FL=1